MNQFTFQAVDEQGRAYPFREEREGNRICLTLDKSLFAEAKRLRVLEAFTETRAGEEGYYLLPRSTQMLGEFLTRFKPRDNVTYTYARPVMSLFGIKRSELCALVRIERNYKYNLQIKVTDGVYSLAVCFDFTRSDPVYDDLRLEVILLPETAGYAEMARTERTLRLERGEITPLAEKCKREAVEYGRKYPLIRIRMGWKPSPSPVYHQTLLNEPEMFVACDFARVRDIVDELIRQGVAGTELQLVGWNISGHDGRFPQLFPADPRLGGDAELKKTIEYVKERGFRISLHTNLIDAVEIADTFTWDDVCIRRDGQYMQAGHYSGGFAYHVCPEKQLKNNRRDLPFVADLGLNGIHFTDVISIVEPDDCHRPEHPVSTGKGIAIAQKIMHETRELMGAFSSEGTYDFALGNLDYGLYVSFGDGFGTVEIPVADVWLPFFELTYHGILMYNPISPTVNYPIKTKRDNLMEYMRGGRPSFYFFSKFRTGGQANWMGEIDLVTTTDEDLSFAVGTVKKAWDEYVAGQFDARQLVYMRDYEVDESGIEAAIYEDGVAIVGNFSDEEQTWRGVSVPAGEYRVVTL